MRFWGYIWHGAQSTPQLRTMICALCLCSVLPFPARASPRPTSIDDARHFDRLWNDYLPSLHYQFIQHIEIAPDLMGTLAITEGVRVRMRLWLDRRGRVRSVDLLDRSPLPRFDHACVRAAKAMGRLRHLPPGILQRGRTHGLEFVFATQ
jgi:TonB family protein